MLLSTLGLDIAIDIQQFNNINEASSECCKLRAVRASGGMRQVTDSWKAAARYRAEYLRQSNAPTSARPLATTCDAPTPRPPLLAPARAAADFGVSGAWRIPSCCIPSDIELEPVERSAFYQHHSDLLRLTFVALCLRYGFHEYSDMPLFGHAVSVLYRTLGNRHVTEYVFSRGPVMIQCQQIIKRNSDYICRMTTIDV
ncbi:unnamed protein product [Leptosia nina]|uniref:Uncharacterized protein n=1 Tax=Leptosia nina TaxID=320188 RepID=A0AAV1J934_9NEOP